MSRHLHRRRCRPVPQTLQKVAKLESRRCFFIFLAFLQWRRLALALFQVPELNGAANASFAGWLLPRVRGSFSVHFGARNSARKTFPIPKLADAGWGHTGLQRKLRLGDDSSLDAPARADGDCV
jgi:hypothetical protein